MNNFSAIEIDNLSVRLGGKLVLSEFSLKVVPSEKVMITGRSGSGKTTLLRCILGFILPNEGHIRIQGEPLTSRSVWKLRTYLAYVAQEPDLGSGTVREILERLFLYRINAPKRGNLSRMPDLMETFRLPSKLLDSDISTLSGGEKQRVAIISADLLDRNIFLLDEASSAQDKVGKQAIADFFCSRRYLTVLSVSHNPDEYPFCGRIVDLHGGGEGGQS